MKHKITLILGAVLCGLLAAPVTMASDQTYFGTIDAINDNLGSGGGLVAGTLGAVDDDDWVTFNAQAGESVELRYTATNTEFLDFVIFRDVNDNGVIEVGDVADILNFNSDRTGAGTDIEVQHAGFSDGSCNASGNQFYCVGNNGVSHTFVAPATGQYVVGISSSNDSQALDWQVEILNREISTPVPVNDLWALSIMVTLMAALGFMVQRRRKLSA